MTPADRLASARAQLKAVKALGKGWDTYDADPPGPVALDRARALVNDSRAPPEKVYPHRPTRDRGESGVRVMWQGVDVTIAHDGTVTVQIWRTTSSISVAVSLIDAATREEPERASAGVNRKEPL